MILKKFHIFIRLSGDVLIVVKHLYYLIDFPSFNADIMVNLLKILEYRKEKELMQYLELILEKHIQRFSEISRLILTSDSSRQEQPNFDVSFFRNIIFISVL
jgi:hypothetical protein